jgi:O-antigen/teichoic acid export membrane protein
MNALISDIPRTDERRRRLVGLFRIFAGYSCVQAIAQAVGFIAGILVVRALPKNEYGWYMIVNTIGPMVVVLSDSGITGSLTAIGGKFWEDNERLGILISTAMALRKRFVIVSGLVVIPLLIWLLARNDAPARVIILLVLASGTGALFQINTGILNVVLTLRQNIGQMQALALLGTFPRFVLILILVPLGLLNASFAAAAGAVCLGLQFFALVRWVKPQIVWTSSISKVFQSQILSIVKRQAPMTIYFCAQGQITTWLISIFGNVERVADVGALGRLGMIFAILMSSFSGVIIPRFARCQDSARLRTHYVWIISGFALCVILTAAFAAAFPRSLLWLLGSQYDRLGHLVWLAVLGAGITNLTGVLYLLNVNKGWIPPASILIPSEIVTQIVLCCLFKVSTVPGVLLVGVFGPVVPGLINLVVGLRKIASLDGRVTTAV